MMIDMRHRRLLIYPVVPHEEKPALGRTILRFGEKREEKKGKKTTRKRETTNLNLSFDPKLKFRDYILTKSFIL